MESGNHVPHGLNVGDIVNWRCFAKLNELVTGLILDAHQLRCQEVAG